jgi:ketosteroid isomerase-like protein
MACMDAQAFAQKWIDSWNSHDLDQVLEHYSSDIVVTTPMIRLATGGNVDSLQGKEAVRSYWKLALEKIPDLHFELIDVASGVSSIALYYRSIMRKMAIEVMFFDADEKVNRMYALYTQTAIEL